MRMSIELPPDVSRRVEAEACRRGVSPQAVVVDALDGALRNGCEVVQPLSFVGIGQARADLGQNYKQIRRDLVSG